MIQIEFFDLVPIRKVDHLAKGSTKKKKKEFKKCKKMSCNLLSYAILCPKFFVIACMACREIVDAPKMQT